MRQYLDTIQFILDNGTWQDNRTGIRSISVPGVSMRWDLMLGYPAITTKKLAFKNVKGELCAFLRGATSAADFRALGCTVWDQNANENAQWLANPYRLGEDDLGAIYGDQWRGWDAFKAVAYGDEHLVEHLVEQGYQVMGEGTIPQGGHGYFLYKAIDLLGDCIRKIILTPTDRRILFHAWNPAKLDEMALPPCHLLYQFLPNVTTKELSLCLYIRSNDMFLGSPFNIAEAALLLELVAHLTGYKAKWLTYFVGDAHIYENTVEQSRLQLTREPMAAPSLAISPRVPDWETIRSAAFKENRNVVHAQIEAVETAVNWLRKVEPDDFGLLGYEHYDAIPAKMAV
jgi:thymidylate synthase